MKIIVSLGLSLFMVAGAATASRAETFRTDINPALLYYQAFMLEPRRETAENDYWVTNDWQHAQVLPEHFGTLINYYHTDLRLWRQAAKQTAPCDWGIDLSSGPETLLPELAHCKQAARVLLLHAKWELQQGNEAGAREDLLAALALGRNSSHDGTLIAVLVQIAIESIVLSGMAENFSHFSPQTLRELAAGFETAPARRSLAECLASENFIAGRWLRSKIQDFQKAHPNDEAAVMEEVRKLIVILQPEGNTNYWPKLTNSAGGTTAGLIKQTRAAEDFSEKLEGILPLPHGEFEDRMDQLIQEVKTSGNFLFGESLNAWPNSRRKEFTIQAELAMMRAAIEYKLHGETGFKSVADPFGNGPFALERFSFQGADRGFQLTSAYVPKDVPVKLIFVEKDGAPFNVLGTHVGQPVTP